MAKNSSDVPAVGVDFGTVLCLVWIPFVIISLIRLFYDPMFLQDVMIFVLNYCLYVCPLISPLISLVGLPSVRRGLRENVCCMFCIGGKNQNRIRPTGTAMPHEINNRDVIPRPASMMNMQVLITE